jgi:hypothetical protein
MRANPHGEQKKSKKKKNREKKQEPQKTSSFSRFETTNFETKQHTLVRVLRDISSCLSLSLSLSRDEDEDDRKGERFYSFRC